MGIAHVLKSVKNTENVVVVDDELLSILHNQLLDMMKDIVKVCNSNDIKWFLSGGSVLGAVRHRGFIPWDDDIDIFMERNDFEKFKVIFNKELGNKYRLRLPGDEGYILGLPQIQKLGTKVKPIQSTEDCCEGLFVDIFLLENTYNDSFRRFFHGLFSTFYLFVDSSLRMEACRKTIYQYSPDDKYVKKEVEKRAKFSFLFHFRSFEKWLLKSDNCFSHVNKRGKYLVCPSGAKHFFGELYDSCMFDEPAMVNFEGEKWNAPNPPEKYLESRFGQGYMTIPKEEDREQHIYLELDLGE